MNMDIRRTILWVVFGMSLVFLWDRWQTYNGRPGLLTPPPAVTTDKADVAKAPATPPGKAPPAAAPSDVPQAVATAPAPPAPASVPTTASASTAERVKVETDVLRVEIDPAGAVLAHVELPQQRVAPDWTATGLLSLFTGKKQDKEANVTLFDVSNARVYVAH